jgi:predicted RND superfamily exporter protein
LTVAIIANFAVMGFAHTTINVATALIASLAVGIGIDYTIHFIDAFKREYAAGGDYLHRTFAGAGKRIYCLVGGICEERFAYRELYDIPLKFLPNFSKDHSQK